MTINDSTNGRLMPIGRIDVHAHHVPAVYRDAALEIGLLPSIGTGRWPEWDVDRQLEHMERHEIAVAMLSMSTPGSNWGDDAKARRLSRQVNEVTAELMRDHPDRFGGFADLPLPDVDGALEELTYALDTLGLDGVCLLTNYLGVYLGDERFDPVMAELDRRGVIVFVHPSSPPHADEYCMGFSHALIELPFDTTRAFTNLILRGTLDRYPNIRFILPHAGGTLPFLVARISMFADRLETPLQMPPAERLASLYYDTALSSSTYHIAGLLELTDVTHVLYGTDYPWAQQGIPANSGSSLAAMPRLSDADLEGIARGHALELFPRLRALPAFQ
jgi:6-methylsalicylate decarboxylase